MKYTFSLLALVAAVSAQNLSGQPACASPCLSAAILSHCAATDQSCACASTAAIGQDAVSCLLKSCSNPLDLAAAQTAGAAVCVVYSSTVATGPASTSATVTSTPSSSSISVSLTGSGTSGEGETTRGIPSGSGSSTGSAASVTSTTSSSSHASSTAASSTTSAASSKSSSATPNAAATMGVREMGALAAGLLGVVVAL